MVEEMDLAEERARSFLSVAATEKETLIATENLMTVLESRTKEALALKDLDLAEVRCTEMLSYDQLDPKNFLELGDILVRRGKIEAALSAYGRAALLGPPATPVALFMMGQLFERLGQREAAALSYLQTLRIDPCGYSAAERLRDLDPSPALTNWACEAAVEGKELQ